MIVVLELREDDGEPCGAILAEECWTRGPSPVARRVPLPLEAFESIQDASAFLAWAGLGSIVQMTAWRHDWVRVRDWAPCSSVGCTERVEHDGTRCASCECDAAQAQRDAAAEDAAELAAEAREARERDAERKVWP